ncbi:MAG: DinB family protein [Streptosporangiaceae bacterium]
MTDGYSAAEHAAQIGAARDRLLAFAAVCTDDQWHAAPLSEQGDGRPAGVIVDHVADAYDYLSSWMSAIVAGDNPPVSPQLVDELNAAHASRAAALTQAAAMQHLQASGDAIVALVSGLDASDLDAGGGRVRRLAEIAARHADDHRVAIEAALRR